MSWRVVVISENAKLDYKMDYMVVRNRETTKRIHLSEISVLLLETTAISITAYLLCELSKRKIDVVFCDQKRLPYGVLMPLTGSHDTSQCYRRQTEWAKDMKDTVWAEIIKSKIFGQTVVLTKHDRPEAAQLRKYLGEIQPGDATNREGHAAKVYFNAIFGMGFSRKAEDNINSALNYGYTILLSAVAREITTRGYATQFGIFHDNVHNALNLASDLMEPFRPFVDMTVLQMDHTDFGKEEKRTLVNVLNLQIPIDGQNQYMLRAIGIYVKSVLDAMNEKDPYLICFPQYEL